MREAGISSMSELGLNTISFAGHAASSSQFKTLYSEGMSLVEETASYLDGQGRAASKVLPRMASVLYAAESMRLTTRLMQMASWLLLQRAVNNGEMSRDQVLTEKNKVRLDGFNVDRTRTGLERPAGILPRPRRTLAAPAEPRRPARPRNLSPDGSRDRSRQPEQRQGPAQPAADGLWEQLNSIA